MGWLTMVESNLNRVLVIEEELQIKSSLILDLKKAGLEGAETYKQILKYLLQTKAPAIFDIPDNQSSRLFK
jgi:hypothetical protein